MRLDNAEFGISNESKRAISVNLHHYLGVLQNACNISYSYNDLQAIIFVDR